MVRIRIVYLSHGSHMYIECREYTRMLGSVDLNLRREGRLWIFAHASESCVGVTRRSYLSYKVYVYSFQRKGTKACLRRVYKIRIFSNRLHTFLPFFLFSLKYDRWVWSLCHRHIGIRIDAYTGTRLKKKVE